MQLEPLYVYAVVVLGFVGFSILYYILDLRKRLRLQEERIQNHLGQSHSLEFSDRQGSASEHQGAALGHQGAVPDGQNSASERKDTSSLPRLEEDLDAEQKLFVRACQYMDEKQPYLNPDMKVDDLVQALHTNRTTLGLAMRKCGPKHSTTQQFIISFRLRYAENLLSDPHSELTVSQVADASGFNSRSAFNRQFTLAYHTTPTLYRMRSRNQADGVVPSKRENTLEK